MTASLIERLLTLGTSPLTHKARRWVPLDEVLALIRQHEAERPKTIEQWQQALDDAIAYRKLKAQQPKASAEVVELLQVAATKACEIAAELVRLDGMPSDDALDYQAKVPKRVLADIERSHKSQIVRGSRLKIGCYDRIKAAIAALQAAPGAVKPDGWTYPKGYGPGDPQSVIDKAATSDIEGGQS